MLWTVLWIVYMPYVGRTAKDEVNEGGGGGGWGIKWRSWNEIYVDFDLNSIFQRGAIPSREMMQWQWQQQARNGGMVTFGWIMDESRFSSVLLRWQHTSSYSERLRESEGDMAQ